MKTVIILTLLTLVGCKPVPKVYSESKNPEYTYVDKCKDLCLSKYDTKEIVASSDKEGNLVECYCE